MKTILITGGAGYIGSHTVKLLVKKKYKVIIIDNLIYGHKWAINKKAKFYNYDLLNRKDIDKIFKNNKIDAVIHFAAFTYVGESVKNPNKYFMNNVIGTLNLLDIMLKYNVKNLVFSSSCAIYGKPSKIPITEEEDYNPTNPYGDSKLFIEKALHWYNKSYAFKSVSLRYFNAAGASSESEIGELHNPETHLIPLILDVAIEKKEFIGVYGNDYPTKDGSCIRDYVHVNDLAKAHVLSLEKMIVNEVSYDSINLGSGKGFSVFNIIREAEHITNKKIHFKIEKRREGDPPELVADIKKAKHILGWSPEESNISNIIKTAWAWHKKIN